MIKTEIQEGRPPVPQYPIIMQDPTGLTVLFQEHGVGTVLHPGELDNYRVGHYSTMWSMNGFEPVLGAVYMENER